MKMRYIVALSGIVYIGAIIYALYGDGITANRVAAAACLVAFPALWLGFKHQSVRFPVQAKETHKLAMGTFGWLFIAISVHSYVGLIVTDSKEASGYAVMPSLALLSIALLVFNSDAH